MVSFSASRAKISPDGRFFPEPFLPDISKRVLRPWQKERGEKSEWFACTWCAVERYFFRCRDGAEAGL